MTSEHTGSGHNPKMFRTLRDDVKRGDFKRTVKRDWADLKELMLDEQRKKRLSEMGAWRRWFVNLWWLFTSLFFKLAPARRILLVAGLFLIITSRSITFSDDSVTLTSDTNGIGILCILFVLGLELKDKLVAKKELEAGRAIQAALMCEPDPNVEGWDLWLFTRSANEVGGDLVDFIRRDTGRFGIVLGDVSGKGLSAALLSVKLQATLRAIASDIPSLGALASKLNTVFCRECLPGVFASLAYLECDEKSGTIRFVNAGHIPPLLVKKEKIEMLEKGGAALGILPTASFTEHEVQLHENEFLLVHSDGLTEAENPAAESYGEKRLVDLLPALINLSARQIGERLVEEVDRFVGDAKVHDDLSIAIVKRR